MQFTLIQVKCKRENITHRQATKELT